MAMRMQSNELYKMYSKYVRKHYEGNLKFVFDGYSDGYTTNGLESRSV